MVPATPLPHHGSAMRPWGAVKGAARRRPSPHGHSSHAFASVCRTCATTSVRGCILCAGTPVGGAACDAPRRRLMLLLWHTRQQETGGQALRGAYKAV